MDLSKENYLVSKNSVWTGRIDDPNDPDSLRMHQVITCIDLNEINTYQFDDRILNICLLGFCCDAGVKKNLGREGAAKGPESIRKEFANLPVRFGNKINLYDAGDILCPDDELYPAQDNLAEAVKIILETNLFPIILGGGHEIALGHYNGIINHYKSLNTEQKLGIINFDAHFDLRPYEKGGTSGTMFSQIADNCKEEVRDFNYLCLGVQTYANTISLFKKAEKLGVKYIQAKDMTARDDQQNLAIIRQFIANVDDIYITVCSDVFNSANAPGVSALQPFGLDPEVVLRYIKEVIKGNKTVSFDIAEVSPRFDYDNRTAKLASVIVYAVINSLVETGP